MMANKTTTKKKPKKKEPVPVNAEEVGTVELSPYEAMDLADEAQIIDELEGKLSPQDMETFVYSFPDKQSGRDVTGLSWKGTKATWWELNNRKLTDMTITENVKITQGEGFIDVAVYAYDKKRKIGAWGMARGYTSMKTRSGALIDRFCSAKAMSKAQRNALNQLFPSDLVAKLIKEWIDKGHSKKLSARSTGRTRQRVVHSSQVYKTPSQEDLMAKYAMDTAQVTPKCPSCGAIMKIVERKDKTGIFWSCKNWRTKGCKGYSIDEVDLDGTITMKGSKPAPKKEEKQVEEVDVDDIPF